MKSMSYILRDKPRTLDDCMDFAKKEPPNAVCLELIAEAKRKGLHVVKNLVACYQWSFAAHRVAAKVNCGSCFFHESEDRQVSQRYALGRMLSIDSANRRIEEDLGRISSLRVTVTDGHQRFDRGLAFKQFDWNGLRSVSS